MSGRRTLRASVALVALLSAGVAVYEGRRPLAAAAVQRYLSARNVPARYAIEELSPRRVVLSGVRLGAARHPDLTADRIEVAVSGYPFAPRVTRLRLARPVLRLSVTKDALSFGSLDALIPAPTGERQPLPAIDLEIVDGLVEADTAWGRLVAAVQGSGSLADGFKGRAMLKPSELVVAGCSLEDAAGFVDVATRRRELTLTSAGNGVTAKCGQATAPAIGWRASLKTDTALERLNGLVQVSAGSLRGAGLMAVRPQIRLTLMGVPDRLAGQWAIETGGARWTSGHAAKLSAHGSYSAVLGQGALDLQGKLSADRVVQDPSTVTAGLQRAAGGTVLESLAAPLVANVAAAAQNFAVRLPVELKLARGGYEVHVPQAAVRTATGVQLALSGGDGIRVSRDRKQAAGLLHLSGGGLPTVSAELSRLALGREASGQAHVTMSEWRAAGAMLAMPALRLVLAGPSVTANGRLYYSGPVATGLAVRGLNLSFAIAGRPAERILLLGRSGVSIRADRLDGQDLHLSGVHGQISPLGRFGWQRGRLVGDVRVSPLQLSGRSAGAALQVRIGEARLHAAGDHVEVSPLAVQARLGDLAVSAQVAGQLQQDGTSGAGKLRGMSLGGGELPVHVADAGAHWTYAGGALELRDGVAVITDAQNDPRFSPLRLTAVGARLAGGEVEGQGTGRLAATGARLLGFTFQHRLAEGAGEAQLATGDLRFSDALQPYQITEALRGVIENVAGTVRGSGSVRWTPAGLTSGGQLAIENVSLATAALGPVTGINGTVVLDDLFALTTPPGQSLEVASMNPGVLVENGRFRFRMLGPTSATIEDAYWPFAGGTLRLRPVTLSMDEPRRAFTLDVTGMDAELFLQRFDLKNLNATGTFDGTLPLLFDGSSGRIVGGVLTARPAGGLLQYVGEVGADSMGAAGRLAFDALKRLRYRSLSVTLDGDLDGEIVTAVRFSGTNEAPVAPAGGVPVRASGLPFKFNVTVRAPFRRLLGTAASFSDAREIVRSATPVDTQTLPGARPEPEKPVQQR